jgi:flagellar assembly protein FliH
LSSTILKDPERARPWPPARLRSSPGGDGSPNETSGFHSLETTDPALAEVDTLLQRAKQEAEELIRSAEEEAESLRAAAREQGRVEGRSECEAERRHVRELAEQVGAAYEQFCRKQVPQLADIAGLAAEKLLGDKLDSEPERVITIVRAALDQVLGSTHVTLRVHPDDIELVQSEFPANPTGHAPAVKIMPDSAVERGGCWIDSEQGKVDATVEGRLSRLQAAIKGV